MGRLQRYVGPLLVVLLVAPGPALAAQAVSGVVTPLELDASLQSRLDSDAAARRSLQALLLREDVRSLAAGYGLEARRAADAVATLQGEELRSLAQQAAAIDAQLAGGDPYIRISLIAALLIVIIIILLAD